MAPHLLRTRAKFFKQYKGVSLFYAKVILYDAKENMQLVLSGESALYRRQISSKHMRYVANALGRDMQ